MKYYNILKVLKTIDDYFEGHASLLDLAFLLGADYNTFKTALLRIGLIDVQSRPAKNLTPDQFTHAILFYFLLLASGKREQK